MGILMLFYEAVTTTYELEEICVRKDHDFDADIPEEEFDRIIEARAAARKSNPCKTVSS